MSDDSLKNQPPEEISASATQENNAVLAEASKPTKIKGSKRKLLLFSGIAFSLLIIGIISAVILFNQLKYNQLVDSYNKEFDLILSASSNFKNQIDTVPDNNKDTLKSIVSYYQELKSKNIFDTQVKDLNNSTKYTTLTKDKKEYTSLGLEKTSVEFNDILKDIDKLQAITQKSDNLDSEIKLLETTNSTINEFNRKTEELIKINNSLKDDILAIVVSIKLKKAQATFADALTYRGKYLVETQSANTAFLDYKVAEDSYNLHYANMNKYKRQAATASYFLYSTYSGLAYEESNNADQIKKVMDQKSEQNNGHKNEAVRMLKKYAELMGITASSENLSNNTVSLPVVTKKKTINDDDVKLFIQDYIKQSIQALNKYDFSIVEPFIDKEGKKYKEQLDYIAYLKSKGISEKLVNVEAKYVEKLNENSYKISTSEKYNISYGDGSNKIKSFNSIYKVIKLENDELRVNELLETTEINSKDN